MNEQINWEKTGRKIKKLMQGSGYTVEMLAEKLHLCESTVKNYIYATTKTPIEVLYKMVDIFQVERIEDIIEFE